MEFTWKTIAVGILVLLVLVGLIFFLIMTLGKDGPIATAVNNWIAQYV